MTRTTTKRPPVIGRYMTPRQVADILGVNCTKVGHFIDSGELSAINVAAKRNGRPRWKISPESLKQFEASRSNSKPAPLRHVRREKVPAVYF